LVGKGGGKGPETEEGGLRNNTELKEKEARRRQGFPLTTTTAGSGRSTEKKFGKKISEKQAD